MIYFDCLQEAPKIIYNCPKELIVRMYKWLNKA